MLEMEEAKNANFYVRELADPDPKKKVRQYVRAQQVYGEGGFTVRQRQYRNAKGQICPAYVTGGGTGDYLCQDLRDSHRFVERAQDFQAHYERVAFNKLPSGIREDLVPDESKAVAPPAPNPEDPSNPTANRLPEVGDPPEVPPTGEGRERPGPQEFGGDTPNTDPPQQRVPSEQE